MYLEQNAYPNEAVVFVTGVDWEVGDTIDIVQSGFGAIEHEIFNIISIIVAIADYDQITVGVSYKQ